jgi:uncharacterized membrane protein YfcA
MSGELTFAVFGLSGLVAGFLAGLFGIGGGLIMVPVLVSVFTATGFATQHVVAMALGTSLAAIVFSAAQSAYGHYKRGSASLDVVRRAAPWVVFGVVFGSVVATDSARTPLLVFIGGFQLFAAALMVVDVSRLGMLKLVAQKDTALRLCSLAFGAVAALAGIGGGTLFTPYFTASGMEPKQAIGTSAAIGLPVSIAGALGYVWEGHGVDLGDCHWMLGYVNLPALVALVIGTLVTVRFGVAVAHRLPARMLAAAFAVFLVINGGHLLYLAAT